MTWAEAKNKSGIGGDRRGSIKKEDRHPGNSRSGSHGKNRPQEQCYTGIYQERVETSQETGREGSGIGSEDCGGAGGGEVGKGAKDGLPSGCRDGADERGGREEGEAAYIV